MSHSIDQRACYGDVEKRILDHVRLFLSRGYVIPGSKAAKAEVHAAQGVHRHE